VGNVPRKERCPLGRVDSSGLNLFEGSVPYEQIKVCNWSSTRAPINIEPFVDTASRLRTLDFVDLLKSRKFALRKVTHFVIKIKTSPSVRLRVNSAHQPSAPGLTMTGMNILILHNDEDDAFPPSPFDNSLVPRGATINFSAPTHKLAETRRTKDSHRRHPSRLGDRNGRLPRGSTFGTEKIGKSLPNHNLSTITYQHQITSAYLLLSSLTLSSNVRDTNLLF
jgi:hypothetical protein